MSECKDLGGIAGGNLARSPSHAARELDAMKLAGEIRDWWYESVTLRLAFATRYTPDFTVAPRRCLSTDVPDWLTKFAMMESAERKAVIRRIEQTTQFERSKASIRATLATLPLVEADWRHGNRFYRAQSAEGTARPVLPFGWVAEKVFDRCAWEIGPAWYMLPRRWFRAARWRFYHTAVRIGALRVQEGGYYSEGEWWPLRDGELPSASEAPTRPIPSSDETL